MEVGPEDEEDEEREWSCEGKIVELEEKLEVSWKIEGEQDG